MLLYIIFAFFKIIFSEFGISGRWNIIALHKFFGECFAAFQLRTLCGRCYKFDMFCSTILFKKIIYAFNQWFFWAGNDHLYVIFQRKFFHCLKIIYANIYIAAVLSGACIAGRDE